MQVWAFSTCRDGEGIWVEDHSNHYSVYEGEAIANWMAKDK